MRKRAIIDGLESLMSSQCGRLAVVSVLGVVGRQNSAFVFVFDSIRNMLFL